MYLRETKRRNRDGSVVSYLQLAHSERHPETGVPSAKVIHYVARHIMDLLFPTALCARRCSPPVLWVVSGRLVAMVGT